MNYEEYLKGVLRTYSDKDNDTSVIVLPVDFLKDLARSIVNIGNIVDMIKKKVFYKRDNFEILSFFSNIPSYCKPLTDNKKIRVVHGLLGIVSEIGEIAELLFQFLLTEDINIVGLTEEVGDLCWYQAVLLDAIGIDINKIWEKNIAKLKVRYPQKWDLEKALNRDLEKEKEVFTDESEHDQDN